MEGVLYYLLLRFLTSRPLSITVYCTANEEEEEVKAFIEKGNFPPRILFTLYVVVTPSQDCIFKKTSIGTIDCVRNKIYPLNRLRNIAIKRVQTTHFIVLDMDTWPSLWTYDEIMKLPKDYLQNENFVTILPVFSFDPSYVDGNRLSSLEKSVETAISRIPSTKAKLVKDFEKGRFTIFRPHSLTHVPPSAHCETVELSSRWLDAPKSGAASHLLALF